MCGGGGRGGGGGGGVGFLKSTVVTMMKFTQIRTTTIIKQEIKVYNRNIFEISTIYLVYVGYYTWYFQG